MPPRRPGTKGRTAGRLVPWVAIVASWMMACDGSSDCPDAGDDAAVSATDSASADAEGPARGVDAAVETSSATDVSDEATSDSSQSSFAGLRVAAWSPDAPALDFCVAPHGTAAFHGPMLGALFASLQDAGSPLDVGAGALVFPQVSAYSYVAPGRYDVRMVVAGAPDCSVGIGFDATTLPVLGAGALETVTVMGVTHPSNGAPGLQLVPFSDDEVAPASGVGLRFIDAATDLLKVDVGLGLASAFQPLFLGVPFGLAGATADAPVLDAAIVTVDGSGYRSLGPLSGVTFVARVPGATSDTASGANVTIAGGSVVTLALVGRAGSEQLVDVVDNAGTSGILADFEVLRP